MKDQKLTSGLLAAISDACQRLPYRWAIHLHMEDGAAWLELEEPSFTTYEPECPDAPFDEQIRQLIDFAHAKAAAGVG